ncbi:MULTISPECIES: efflux RND transporter periplasmic adaptor subunit [Methylobacterium]|uniref:Multidrug resistance protein MdtA n=2 Tax=Methylobacterium TaxID=407 RepID=A0A509EG82_9HYPH|nr:MULTISPECIES: efflux RND transporter periplasmic adaptor subunit [Methylobacterium]GJD56287.1 Multidrug resistance protein MdtA [Methylobacterium dankookense]VUD72439.1 Multidrug resistance protein MdtA [Methylobacterium symbioticum]VUF13684.1 Multidrug resistance protein MdtA [Methylobacterium dankookense]
MRTRLRYGLAGLALILVGIGAWAAMGHPLPAAVLKALPASLAGRLAAAPPSGAEADQKGPGEPEFAVGVVEAKMATVPISFDYTGVIVSPQDAALQPRVTGAIIERPFEPGGTVKKDQVLFRIDPRPFEVALKDAKAQSERAKAALEFAEAEVQRTDTLADKGYATQQRLQQLESNRTSAKSQVQAAEAAIARAQLDLDYAVIKAPFDGRASLSGINIGDLVTANATNLVSVVQIDPIDVQVALSTDDSKAVRAAMQGGGAALTVLGDDDEPGREAKVYKLDNRFDPATARRLIRAKLANADGLYLPGEFIRTRLQVGRKERLLVPTRALSAQLDQRIVWSIGADCRISMRPVETGGSYGDQTEIVSGLKPGTRIASDHLQRLSQNLCVGVRPAAKADIAQDGTRGMPQSGSSAGGAGSAAP